MTALRRGGIRMVVVLIVLLLFAAAWKWTNLREWADPQRLARAFEPYRHEWLAFPATLIVFLVAEMFLFPVVVLVFVCGLVFGPWLGALYATSGSMLSAIPPFLLGRHLGREKLEHMGGAIVGKLERVLDRRGIIAVFLVRKIPAPYSLVNLVCGASPVSLRDFLLGTLLGMGTGIVLITFVGGQLLDIVRDPGAGEIALALFLLLVPVVLAIVVQRFLNRRAEVGR